MADTQTKLKKHQTMLFIDTAAAEGPESWARIGKSTMFELATNPNVVTNNYIEDEMPTDEVDYYKPSMEQELQTIKGDKAFDFLYDMLYNLPTGEDIKKNVLIVFAGDIGDVGTPKFNAWKCKASIQVTSLNTVDEKINFTIGIISIENGTVTVSEGVPTFESSAV